MVTLDEYAAAKDQKDRARAQVVNVGNKLRQVADMLQTPERVRVNEQTITRMHNPPGLLDESDLPSWTQIADTLRAFGRAQDNYLVVDASLSPDHRRHVSSD